jgi:hypothetical protein
VSEELPDTSFESLVAALADWCRSEGVPFALIGGLAVALRGYPRMTEDVDAVAMVPDDRLPQFMAAGAAFGFQPRIADAVEYARRARVLLCRFEETSIGVDISLGALLFEQEMIERANEVDLGGTLVPVPTTEDLIMKVFSRRDRDRADAAALLRLHPDLDLRRIRHWIAAFAELLDSPDMVHDLEALLRSRST